MAAIAERDLQLEKLMYWLHQATPGELVVFYSIFYRAVVMGDLRAHNWRALPGDTWELVRAELRRIAYPA